MNELSKLFDEKISCELNGIIINLSPVSVEDFISIDKHLADEKTKKIVDLVKIFDSEEAKNKMLDKILEMDIESERQNFLNSFNGIVFVFKRIFKRSYPEYSEEQISSVLSMKNMKGLTDIFGKLSNMGKGENEENPKEIPSQLIGD